MVIEQVNQNNFTEVTGMSVGFRNDSPYAGKTSVLEDVGRAFFSAQDGVAVQEARGFSR
jgi:hypothetical protein